MPASGQEVEAAEHEGVHIQFEGGRLGRVVGSAERRPLPSSYVSQSSDGTVRRAPRRSRAPDPGSNERSPPRRPGGCGRGGPIPSILPKGTQHRDQRFLGHRCGRGSGHGCKGVFAGGDVFSAPKHHPCRRGTAAAPPARSTSTSRAAATARPRSWPRSACPRARSGPHSGSGHQTASRGWRLPAYEAGFLSRRPNPAWKRGGPETKRSLLPACEAIYRCATVQVQSGRGPGTGPGDGRRCRRTPKPTPARGPSEHSSRFREVATDGNPRRSVLPSSSSKDDSRRPVALWLLAVALHLAGRTCSP